MNALNNTHTLVDTYRRFRAANLGGIVGEDAKWALRHAKAYLRFLELESKGYARIRVEFDDDCDTSWVDDQQRSDWNGEAYGTIAEVRLPMPEGFEYSDDNAHWEHADSCWGHIGYQNPGNPFENPHVADEMVAAVEMFDSICLELAEAIEDLGTDILARYRRRIA